MNKEEISNWFINTIKSCQQIKINSKHYNNIIYFIETDKNTLRKMKLCKLNDQKFNNNQTKGNCVFAINLDVTDAYYKLDCNYTIFDIFKNKYFKLNNIFYNEKIIENMIKSILNENKIFVDINISFCNFNQQYFIFKSPIDFIRDLPNNVIIDYIIILFYDAKRSIRDIKDGIQLLHHRSCWFW